MPRDVRSGKHLGISPLTGKRVKCKPSPVSNHLSMQNHDTNFNEFTILCQDNNGFRLLLKESTLISRDSPVLDKNTAMHLFHYYYLIKFCYYLWNLVNFRYNTLWHNYIKN